jgi:hypothetical protein
VSGSIAPFPLLQAISPENHAPILRFQTTVVSDFVSSKNLKNSAILSYAQAFLDHFSWLTCPNFTAQLCCILSYLLFGCKEANPANK